MLETNYDPWTKPPKDDDRRDAGLVAMDKVTQAKINQETLYNVSLFLTKRKAVFFVKVKYKALEKLLLIL